MRRELPLKFRHLPNGMLLPIRCMAGAFLTYLASIILTILDLNPMAYPFIPGVKVKGFLTTSSSHRAPAAGSRKIIV